MKNFKLLFRKLGKNKSATYLGTAGLVTGLMCVVYIFLIVTDEIGFDRFHKNLDKIIVVHAYLEGGTEKTTFSGCPPAVGVALKDEYPEVVNMCRYTPPYFNYTVAYGDKRFTERTAYADFSFFDIFSFPFIYGDKGEENNPDRVVLTQNAAQRYFGKENPVGKKIRMDNRLDLTVTGVIKDIPKNSSINFDAIIPLVNIGYYYSRADYLTSWYNNSFITFGLLNSPEGFDRVASTITKRIQKELPESINYLRAYKFKNTYLYEQKNIKNLRIYILTALLVLLAATLNFINLNTARSARQAKETGLRKTFGATRINVIRLIYYDVALICMFAFAIAIFIVYLGLPFINKFTGKDISLSSLIAFLPVIMLIAVYLFTVLLAGSYPAMYLSSFSPGQILTSGFQTVKSRGILRNVMIAMIFVVSIILLSSTIIISQQTRYLQKMDLGFDKEQLIYVALQGKQSGQYRTLKQELARNPGIISSCAISHLPTKIGNNGENWKWEGKDPNFKPLVTVWQTDEDFVKTFGAKMAEGEFYNRNSRGIVINKTFANLIGWDSFTGKTLANDTSYNVQGVINDIHFNSLATSTKPMVMGMIQNYLVNFLIIKISTDNVPGTLDYIRKTFLGIDPSFPFEYAFLNDEYNRLLASEINMKKLTSLFSVLSIIVLSLGLLGMVIFLIEQKTKEMGIRKCMGENVLSTIGHYLKPFLISGIIAAAIAIPLTWHFMEQWLLNYAYHIQLKIWVFGISGLIVIIIAILTVSWNILRASVKNPVDALRYE
jgi:putative ABC transport system permease protein